MAIYDHTVIIQQPLSEKEKGGVTGARSVSIVKLAQTSKCNNTYIGLMVIAVTIVQRRVICIYF
jgi:hypothetical protein